MRLRILKYLILIFLIGCNQPKEKSVLIKKTTLDNNEIKSMYLKSELYGKDSLKLNSEQINYFAKQWNTAKSVGMWKYIPKFWINIKYKNGERTYFKNSGKLIKHENDFTYQLDDTIFIKTIWENRIINIK